MKIIKSTFQIDTVTNLKISKAVHPNRTMIVNPKRKVLVNENQKKNIVTQKKERRVEENNVYPKWIHANQKMTHANPKKKTHASPRRKTHVSKEQILRIDKVVPPKFFTIIDILYHLDLWCNECCYF